MTLCLSLSQDPIPFSPLCDCLCSLHPRHSNRIPRPLVPRLCVWTRRSGSIYSHECTDRPPPAGCSSAGGRPTAGFSALLLGLQVRLGGSTRSRCITLLKCTACWISSLCHMCIVTHINGYISTLNASQHRLRPHTHRSRLQATRQCLSLMA